jgi:hypothetical protein
VVRPRGLAQRLDGVPDDRIGSGSVPDDEAEGDTPPDLDSRIDSLLNPGGPTK